MILQRIKVRNVTALSVDMSINVGHITTTIIDTTRPSTYSSDTNYFRYFNLSATSTSAGKFVLVLDSILC